ncbi:TOBE domain-containing protein [Conservatibacter flavescens]|uniref:Molybdenum-dependent transcriptional regulator n=1 Tax=Conservatibacter flavescens TaxID=28161 RepID=A0A2M8S3Z1_9PAST|nr:TOBE domain-containing protein [Conservatibacter flavescens]PJG85856.1 molybdenum-dependent transcriptional regulator [Conservatibacter flavescens]
MLNTEILLTIKLQQQLFVDPKRIRLLKEIQQCGSINQAAKNARVSYKSAWDHLQAMNEISPSPLLERNTGGKNGGGTLLTPYAVRLLQLYDLLEQTQEKAFSILQDENVPLDSLLSATARFSLQSSARNQLFGRVHNLTFDHATSLVEIKIPTLPHPVYAAITEKSAVRLGLKTHQEVMLMFKAPWVKISQEMPSENNKNIFQGKVISVTSKGEDKEVMIRITQEIALCARLSAQQHIVQDDVVWAQIDPEQIILATLF